MLYLLDANVLISAHRGYYSLQRVPEFWSWLIHIGEQGHAKLPLEVYEEISDASDDELAKWVRTAKAKRALVLDEDVQPTLVALATETGYADDLTDDEVVKIGRDPFLIAYALVAPKKRCVVTTEVSKQTKTRGNRHLPDVCKTLGVASIDGVALLTKLDFTTDWTTASR